MGISVLKKEDGYWLLFESSTGKSALLSVTRLMPLPTLAKKAVFLTCEECASESAEPAPSATDNTSIMQLLREWMVMEFTDKPLPQPEYDSLIRRTYAVIAQLHN